VAVGQHKDGRWYVYGRKGFFPDDANRTREYFGRGPDAEARARERNRELSGATERSIPLAGPTFGQLAAEYATQKNFRPKSQRELEIRLESIILPILGNRSALKITNADLDRYVSIRRSHKTKRGTYLKDSTIRREITDIKAIMNWSTKCTPPLIRLNPIAFYQAPAADDDVILPPTPEEAERIYNAASAHLRRAISLSWYLGLRPGAVELLDMTWHESVQSPLLPAPWDDDEVRASKYDHIDDLLEGNDLAQMNVGIIRIRSAHKGGPQLRDVPIHPGLFRHLRKWHEQDGGRGYLVHYYGKRISKIQKSWEGAIRRAGITRRLRPYDLRHHFVTQALENGADIGALSDIVGSRPETLRRHYQHVSREHRRQTVALIPELDIDKKS
jgi:integrase